MSPRRRHARPQRSFPWPVRLLLGLVVAFTVLSLAEGAARLSGIATAYQPDRIGGWRMLPAQQNAVINGQEGHSFRMSTNADGLRTALGRARTPGKRRVAILGDSIAFGWGANDGGTLADGMQEGFRELGLSDVEVLNAAQPGYSTSQIARFAEQIVQLYSPDLAIVFLPMHDHNLVLVSDREHLRGADGPFAAVRVALAKRSSLYEMMRRALFPMADQAFVVARPDQAPPAEPRVPRVSERERAQNISEIQAALGASGGRVALGHMPFESDLTSSDPMPRLGDVWAETYANEHGLPLIDLRPCCGPNGGNLVFPYDRGHLTAEGNRKAGRYAATLVAKVLESNPGASPD